MAFSDVLAAFNESFVRQMDNLFPKPDPRMQISAINDRQRQADSILARCLVSEASGCWEWQRAKSKRGYGRVKIEGRLVSPHRVTAWAVGLVESLSDPERNACVLHRCDNPKCVNPNHLFVGSLSDNMQDCSRKGRIANQKKPWKPKRPKPVAPEKPAFRYKYPKPPLIKQSNAHKQK